MATRPKDIRKSTFSEVTASQASDYFDLVRNGQNLKIKQSNLVSDFGATGSIEQQGEVTATPVLDKVGDVNYIRNILGGSGILTNTSPLDGVEISHNFDVNKDGVPIVENEGGVSPVIRSIQAGAGITVGGSSGVIQIDLSGVPASTKTINVYDISDFPSPSGGIITLADDTEYFVLNDITTANRFIMGNNTVLRGSDQSLITLAYSGTGVMLTSSDKNCKIRDLNLTATTGTLFDVSSSTGAHDFKMCMCSAACNEVGDFDNLNNLYLHNVCFTAITTQGFTFTNNFKIVLFDIVQATMASGAGNLVNLGTATFDYFTVDKGVFDVNTTGYILTGLASSGNINANGLGVVTNCRQFGSASTLNNISPYDDRWTFILNPSVQDSMDLCLVSHSGVTLTITAPATPVIVGATWIEQDTHRFSFASTGRFTYTGKGTHVNITASITADITTGIDDLSFFLYKNGSQITASRVTREFDGGDPGNVSLIWSTPLATNDYLELWAQNDDTSIDIIIVKIVLRVSS